MARPSKTGIKGLHKDQRGRWCIDFRYFDPSTGKMRRYCEDLPPGITATAARERARIALNAAYDGQLAREPARVMRLHDALDEYLKWCKTNRPKTIADRSYLVAVLKRHLGNMPLPDLSAFAVEKLKRERASEGVAPATVNRAVAVLKHMVGLAATWGWIPNDVAASVRSARNLVEPPGRVRYLSDHEQRELLRALRADVREVAITAILTGMRLGEITRLKKADVDLDMALLTVSHTKTNRVRRIPIHPLLDPILRAAMDRSKMEHVFTNLAGRPHSHRASQIFRDCVRRLGLRDLRFHDLRHDFATRLRMEGTGLDTIAKLLGHTTLAMTQRYAHIEMDLLRDAVIHLRTPPANDSDRS